MNIILASIGVFLVLLIISVLVLTRYKNEDNDDDFYDVNSYK